MHVPDVGDDQVEPEAGVKDVISLKSLHSHKTRKSSSSTYSGLYYFYSGCSRFWEATVAILLIAAAQEGVLEVACRKLHVFEPMHAHNFCSAVGELVVKLCEIHF